MSKVDCLLPSLSDGCPLVGAAQRDTESYLMETGRRQGYRSTTGGSATGSKASSRQSRGHGSQLRFRKEAEPIEKQIRDLQVSILVSKLVQFSFIAWFILDFGK